MQQRGIGANSLRRQSFYFMLMMNKVSVFDRNAASQIDQAKFKFLLFKGLQVFNQTKQPIEINFAANADGKGKVTFPKVELSFFVRDFKAQMNNDFILIVKTANDTFDERQIGNQTLFTADLVEECKKGNNTIRNSLIIGGFKFEFTVFVDSNRFELQKIIRSYREKRDQGLLTEDEEQAPAQQQKETLQEEIKQNDNNKEQEVQQIVQQRQVSEQKGAQQQLPNEYETPENQELLKGQAQKEIEDSSPVQEVQAQEEQKQQVEPEEKQDEKKEEIFEEIVLQDQVIENTEEKPCEDLHDFKEEKSKPTEGIETQEELKTPVEYNEKEDVKAEEIHIEEQQQEVNPAEEVVEVFEVPVIEEPTEGIEAIQAPYPEQETKPINESSANMPTKPIDEVEVAEGQPLEKANEQQEVHEENVSQQIGAVEILVEGLIPSGDAEKNPQNPLSPPEIAKQQGQQGQQGKEGKEGQEKLEASETVQESQSPLNLIFEKGRNQEQVLYPDLKVENLPVIAKADLRDANQQEKEKVKSQKASYYIKIVLFILVSFMLIINAMTPSRRAPPKQHTSVFLDDEVTEEVPESTVPDADAAVSPQISEPSH